jgi:hypothetical protein
MHEIRRNSAFIVDTREIALDQFLLVSWIMGKLCQKNVIEIHSR